MPKYQDEARNDTLFGDERTLSVNTDTIDGVLIVDSTPDSSHQMIKESM